MSDREPRRRIVATALAPDTAGLFLVACSHDDVRPRTAGTTTSTTSTTIAATIVPTPSRANVAGTIPPDATYRTPTLSTPTPATVGDPPPGTCSESTASPPVASQTPHTNAVADVDPERFAVVVVPDPPAACPGDTVDFVVFVENLTNSPQIFLPHYGLLLTNGPQRHIIAGFGTTVDAGETVSVVVTATQPDLRPGTYGVWAVSGPGGTFRMLDPATAGS